MGLKSKIASTLKLLFPVLAFGVTDSVSNEVKSRIRAASWDPDPYFTDREIERERAAAKKLKEGYEHRLLNRGHKVFVSTDPSISLTVIALNKRSAIKKMFNLSHVTKHDYDKFSQSIKIKA